MSIPVITRYSVLSISQGRVSLKNCGWVGGFSKVVAIFNHVGGSFNLSWPHRVCLNNPIFSTLGLCAACWAHFMCHHGLWPTSVSHPFSFLNSSLGLTGGKYYQKNRCPYLLDLFFKILLFQAAFLMFFSIAIFSPYFFLVGSLL